jgi:hypothetical protein
MKIVEKHTPREFRAMSHNGGIVLCDDQDGAFLVLRFVEEVEALRLLLNGIGVERLPHGGSDGSR